jgi:hypothetical protein
MPEEIRSLARTHCRRAIERLAGIVDASLDEQAVVRAATQLLDRGYGKPNQPHTGDEGGAIEITIRNIMEGRR